MDDNVSPNAAAIRVRPQRRRNDYALTIYIPSFGRPDSCLDQVQRVSSQRVAFGSPLRIVVAINGDKSYSPSALLASGADTVVERPLNLGGNANICLGYEWMSESDYLWILSDDDAIQPDALSRLASAIEGDPDIVVGTRRPSGRTQLEFPIRGDLARHGAATDLISASIYRSTVFSNAVELAFEGIVTSYPHACLISHVESLGEISSAVLIGLSDLVDDEPSVKAAARPRNEMGSGFGVPFFGGALAVTLDSGGGFDGESFRAWWRMHWHRASMYRNGPSVQQQWADRIARSSIRTLPWWVLSIPPYWKLKDLVRPYSTN